MATKTKLELTWIGKDNRPRLEPRLLIEDDTFSHHASARRESDIFDNVLIRGDNLLALKALESSARSSVKCIFIDPPYNTGSAFTHYDDGVEHSAWLTLLRDRLVALRELLAEDGSIWISLDDNEAHYFKVMADEVFGRSNFIDTIVWQKVYTVKNSARHFSSMHDYILVYAKNAEAWTRRLLPRSSELDASYKNPDNDPRGAWTTNAIQGRNYYSLGSYEIVSPTGRSFRPPSGTYWRVSEAKFRELNEDNRIWWGADGGNVPRIKKFLSEAKQGVVPSTFWPYSEAGHNAEAKEEVRRLLPEAGDDVFMTPKPERLIRQVLEIATQPGDLVLDSFAGSGTTGAVAHKMGRRWIMVELGDHCETHIVPRLKKVIDGEDPGGITEAVGWKGGGGYRYFKLAPSLLEKDQFGNWVISKSYNAEMLAEAMCKHFGFTYAPSAEHYWMHGHSSETDFIYVTTNSLTHEQLAAISDEVGPERTLLICCKAFQGGNADAFDNLTIRKIPGAILDRCEWGKDDYSLKIEALPLIEDEPEEATAQTPRRKSAVNLNQPGLFNGDEGAGA